MAKDLQKQLLESSLSKSQLTSLTGGAKERVDSLHSPFRKTAPQRLPKREPQHATASFCSSIESASHCLESSVSKSNIATLLKQIVHLNRRLDLSDPTFVS